MDTSSPFEESFIETLEVSSSTSTSIYVGWQIHSSILPFVEGFRVHYQKVASTYVQYGPRLDPSEAEYAIRNLVADTYYKVCLVVYRNYTSPFRECVDASTTNWQLPVSVGSSIGAVLALSMIVLIVLLSRCQIPVQYQRRKRTNSSRYDTMSSNYHDERYDFSETVTHGNDDDFASEFDHDEDGYCEISANEQTRPKYTDKHSIANGLLKNHVYPHVHLQHQHRNSLGRIQCPSSHSGHHRPRPIRAQSINTEAHAAFLNQHFSSQRKQKLPVAKDCHSLDEILPSNFVEKSKRPPHIRKQHSMNKDDLLKYDIDHKQRPPLLSQHSTQGFSYIDEMQDVSRTPNTLAQRNVTPPDANANNTEKLALDNIKFDDLSAFGAVGGISESIVGHRPVRHWDSTKPVEMSHKQTGFGLGDSASFDEHAL